MSPETVAPEKGLVFVDGLAFGFLADEYLGEEGRATLQGELLKTPRPARR